MEPATVNASFEGISGTYTSAYSCSLEDARAMLDAYGVAVIENVLTKEECTNIVSTLWDNLEYASSKWEIPINREDQSTWSMDNFSVMHGMLSQHHSIGHWQAAWDIRQNESVVEVFSTIWDCEPEDLVSSFDGVSISLPPEITGKGWYRKNSLWLHCDTSFYYSEDYEPEHCVQGWVTPIRVSKGDATLAFLRGSHKYHRQFSEKYGITEKADWYKLSEEQVSTYVTEYECPLERITCPAGSIVLWDSKLIHCGQQPIKGRSRPNYRFCFYVCQMPRDRATEAQLRKKRKAFEELRLTTHNPIKVKLFPKNPRLYGGDHKEGILPPPEPELTDLGRRLAGY